MREKKADLRDYHAARRDDWKAYAGGPLHLSSQSRFPRDGSGKKGLKNIKKKDKTLPTSVRYLILTSYATLDKAVGGAVRELSNLI